MSQVKARIYFKPKVRYSIAELTVSRMLDDSGFSGTAFRGYDDPPPPPSYSVESMSDAIVLASCLRL